jgi:hypothetical protein
MCASDCEQIGLRVAHETEQKLCDLFSIADKGRKVRGGLSCDIGTIYQCRIRGQEYVVKYLFDGRS